MNSPPPVFEAGAGDVAVEAGAEDSGENSDGADGSAEEMGDDSWAVGPLP